MLEVVRAHPHAHLCRRAGVQRDGRGGGVVLPRAQNAVRSAVVVDHQNARLSLCGAGAGRRRLADLGKVLHVVVVDGIAVVVKELRRFRICVEVVDLVLEVIVKFQAVVGGHLVVVPVRNGVLDGSELPAGSRNVVPFRRIDEAGRRIGGGGAGRERPARGRGDEVELFLPVLNVHLRIELKVAVADGLGIRLRGRRLLLVVRRIFGGSAGGKNAHRERCRKRERERRNGAAPEFLLGIDSHRSSFFPSGSVSSPYFVLIEILLYFNIKCFRTQAIPRENRYEIA